MASNLYAAMKHLSLPWFNHAGAVRCDRQSLLTSCQHASRGPAFPMGYSYSSFVYPVCKIAIGRTPRNWLFLPCLLHPPKGWIQPAAFIPAGFFFGIFPTAQKKPRSIPMRVSLSSLVPSQGLDLVRRYWGKRQICLPALSPLSTSEDTPPIDQITAVENDGPRMIRARRAKPACTLSKGPGCWAPHMIGMPTQPLCPPAIAHAACGGILRRKLGVADVRRMPGVYGSPR